MKKILLNPFFSISGIFLLVITIFWPFQNFAINDDWIFSRQIEHFRQGFITVSQIIDPTFISQGILGFIWSLFFGYSFVSLRILTIVCTLFLILGLVKIFKYFNSSSLITFLAISFFIFNPIVLISSLSFMTEIYYLLFFVWSIYFYLLHLKKASLHNFLLSLLMALLAFCVRQCGVVLFMAILFIEFLQRNSSKKSYKYIYMIVIFVILAFLIYFIWPRYGNVGLSRISGNSILVNTKLILNNLLNTLFSPIYLIYLSLPIALFSKINIPKKYWVICLLFLITFTFFIFKYDVFPIGNVFNIEGMFVKSDFKHNLSLGDNIFIKLLLSLIISFSLVKFSISLYQIKKEFKKPNILFLSILTVLSSGFLLIVSDYYDRYLLPTCVSFLILVAALIPIYFIKFKLKIITLILLTFFNLAISYDYIFQTKYLWELGEQLQKDKNVVMQIYVNSVFGRYSYAKKYEDFRGADLKGSSKESALCFVQDYTTEETNLLFKLTLGIDSFLEKFLSNPRPLNSRKKEIPSIKKNLDKLVYNKEYFSPFYNIVGKKAFVGAWCLE